MKKKDNLAKNTLLLAIGTFLNKGLQFIMIPLFSRWLSTEDYGTFDLFSTYVILILPLVTLACSESVFRYGVEQESVEGKQKYITNGAGIVLVNSAILAVVIAILGVKLQWQYAAPFLFMAFGEIINYYLQGYMRAIRKLNIYSFCAVFSTLFIAVFSTTFVLFLDMELYGLIWGYAAGYLAGDLAIILFTGYRTYFNPKCLSLATVKEIVAFSYPLIPNDLSWWIINVSDRSIISMFLGTTFNGIYAIACKVQILQLHYSAYFVFPGRKPPPTLHLPKIGMHISIKFSINYAEF